MANLSERLSLTLKRLTDVIVSVVLYFGTSPISIIVAILIRLKLGMPVFFFQLRPGKNGKPFLIYKFRTMSNKVDTDGEMLPDKDRLDSFGRTIRAFSLDELPEFINVIKGDMSLVGPRPLLIEYLNRYSSEQNRRHEVKPGMTGLAQIKGRNAIAWEDKFMWDVWYVDNKSLKLDLKIVLDTLVVIIKRIGINSPGQSTSTKFMGNASCNDNFFTETGISRKG